VPSTSSPQLPDLHPFTGMDVWTLLSHRARSTPGDFLIWHPFEGVTRTWDYSTFARDAASVGAGLHARGVKSGDRVIIHLENCPEFLIAWFACASIGAVAVTTNARSAEDEMTYFANDCAAVGAITQPKYLDMLGRAAPQLKWLACIERDPGIGEPTFDRVDSDLSFDRLRADPESLPQRSPDPAALMNIQYTSGTTSRPKGVLWTHANALWAARVNAIHEHLVSDDCHLTYMPLFHANALGYSVLPTMWVGGRTVLLHKWSTSRFWDISLEYRCTWASLMGLSARAVLELETPKQHDYRCFGSMAYEPRFESHVGVKALGWWGMTETVSHGILGNYWGPNRPKFIGRPAPEYGIRIVRDDGVTSTDCDEAGELFIKGVPGLSLFAGYLNRDQSTAESFDEQGWFRTGDLVEVNADGNIAFGDRAKDMLRVGGENVAASEIERVILEVVGVREAVVVGKPDTKLDEVPVAFVVRASVDEGLHERIMTACSSKLADFKIPRQVEIVDALPRSTIGKVNRADLRQVLSAGKSISESEKSWLEAAAIDPSGDAS
jgi:crotonobetaine/carnitine-CoA ligase